MDRRLEARLKDEFPGCCWDKYGPVQESRMHRGCECGDGWFSLIELLCRRVQG
jgi:hypothetical protein